MLSNSDGSMFASTIAFWLVYLTKSLCMADVAINNRLSSGRESSYSASVGTGVVDLGYLMVFCSLTGLACFIWVVYVFDWLVFLALSDFLSPSYCLKKSGDYARSADMSLLLWKFPYDEFRVKFFLLLFKDIESPTKFFFTGYCSLSNTVGFLGIFGSFNSASFVTGVSSFSTTCSCCYTWGCS